MITCLVILCLVAGSHSLSCPHRLDYLSIKAKVCAAGDLCYTETKRLVDRVVREGCLSLKADSPLEDGPYGKMRTYLVEQDTFTLSEGQLLKLPALKESEVAVTPVRPEDEQRRSPGVPIVELFTLEGGKIVHTKLDPSEIEQ